MRFSLPTQRCFYGLSPCVLRVCLFSAYAEVFPTGMGDPHSSTAFLCLRRGVSISEGAEALEGNFSLPTQRCFSEDYGSLEPHQLFSAYAEVFPTRKGKRGGA